MTRVGKWSNSAPMWGAGLFGLLYYLAVGGLPSLHPAHIAWLQKDNDWSQHYLGWAFLRQSGWTWPFGLLPQLGEPVGTRVAFMDSNPLLSALFLPFSPFLPLTWQFIGPWMAFCFFLQGFLGARLITRLCPAKSMAGQLAIFLGGCLLVLAPPLLHRINHDTLMAHWLILWALGACLGQSDMDAPAARSHATLATIACWLTATIHPYLLAMVLPLCCAAIVTLMRAPPQLHLSWREATARIWVTLGGVAAILGIMGYFSAEDSSGGDGFGFFSIDLLSLINPMGWSRLLPSLPHHKGQGYEGFAYLGLGTLLLLVLLAMLLFSKKAQLPRSPGARVAAGLSMAMAIFALSDTPTLLGVPLCDASSLYRFLGPIPAMLRSSGRFIWALHYVLVLTSIITVIRSCRPKHAAWAIGAAVAVQLIDVAPQDVAKRFMSSKPPSLEDPIWAAIAAHSRHIVMYPPLFSASIRLQCGPYPTEPKFEVPPAIFAAKHGLSINSVYTSRTRERLTRRYCAELTHEVTLGHFATDTLYLVDPRASALFLKFSDLIRCFTADRRLACIHREHPYAEKLTSPG